jgi:hypothetical protein
VSLRGHRGTNEITQEKYPKYTKRIIKMFKEFDKAVKIIASCQSQCQLKVAISYCELVIKKYPEEPEMSQYLLDELDHKRQEIYRKTTDYYTLITPEWIKQDKKLEESISF